MQSAGKPTQPGIDLALPREKTQEEINIEKSGDIDALQRYRRNVVIGRSRYTGPVVELLRIEQDLRSTAQEEQYLSQKTKITGRWPLLRHDIQAELQTLNKRYWLLERQWWEARNSFVEGLLIRAFDLWRSHPLWYMHEFCSRIAQGGEDAVAVAVDVALIAILIRQGSLELDIVL
ncbi:hypothetical protein N7534_001440 [Penicillium rubens]|nr:hypothetical protein N7534_001440 [Penicillium rubens]